MPTIETRMPSWLPLKSTIQGAGDFFMFYIRFVKECFKRPFEWKEFINYRWYLFILLILIFILPELYCLYVQFDMHPEKIVFGTTNVSGIKFFFWDSQFGRFFNTGPIKGRGHTLFFFHTLLWAFLPWSVLLYCAMARRFKSLVQKDVLTNEWFSFAGAMLTFILFSLSRFQLPHYMNIVFPFFAIITANYLFTVTNKTFNYLKTIQNVVLLLLCIGVVALYIFCSDKINWVLLTTIIIGFVLAFALPVALISNAKERIVVRTVLTAIILNLYLNLNFYPSLLTYQSGSEAAFFANKNYKDLPVVEINSYCWPLQFYLNNDVHMVDISKMNLPPRPYLIYIATPDINLLKSKGIQYSAIKQFDDFKVSQLSLNFLNKNKRINSLSEYQLLLVK